MNRLQHITKHINELHDFTSNVLMLVIDIFSHHTNLDDMTWSHDLRYP